VRNSIEIRSDLTFVFYNVWGFTFLPNRVYIYIYYRHTAHKNTILKHCVTIINIC